MKKHYSIGPSDNSESRNLLSVMSINLRFGHADDGDNSWVYRKKAYPELFKTVEPDFIGVQESNNHQTEFLSDLLDKYNFIGMRDPSPARWQNNLIFFRKEWKCLKSRHCFISETPDRESKLEESKWPRQCVIGLFEKDCDKILVANTHFDFKESVQKKSAELILDFIKDFPHTVPIIITGDFNAHPESKAHKVFTGSGFKDAFNGVHSSTFHGFTGRKIGGHVDWILYRGDLQVKEREVIEGSFMGKYPSDHFPVTALFRPFKNHEYL